MPFELKHDPRNITHDDLLSDLRRVAEGQTERIVKQRTYKELGLFGVTTVFRRFRSWNGAIAAAGLAKTVERNNSDEDLFTALYDSWLLLGRQPGYSEIRKRVADLG